MTVPFYMKGFYKFYTVYESLAMVSAVSAEKLRDAFRSSVMLCCAAGVSDVSKEGRA